MKGGFNNPPNDGHDTAAVTADLASMKGGFNNPPNAEVASGVAIARRLQ